MISLLLATALFFQADAPPPAASTDAPLSIKIIAQREKEETTEFVCGDLVRLSLQEAGPIAARTWKVAPVDPGFLISDDSQQAFFTSRYNGVYRFTVAASGQVGGKLEVEIAEIEITLTGGQTPGGVITSKASMPKMATTAKTGAAAETPADRIDEAIKKSHSTNPTFEAKKIAEAFRTTATGIKGGIYSKGRALVEAQRLAGASIGRAIEGWQPLFDEAAKLNGELAKEGKLNSDDEYANSLNNTAKELDKVK